MGSLEIIMGPMFSGKTEALIEKYKTLSSSNIMSFNFFKDTRYGDNVIASHSGLSIPCKNIQTISETIHNVKDAETTEYILINEAQFFSDLKENVVKLVETYNKKVIICGLDCDYKREKFGEMWDLIPYADTVIKLKGKCNNCNNDSLFTHRISKEQQQELIGNDIYIPLCRKCYKILNTNI
jgi:thymidine kinase